MMDLLARVQHHCTNRASTALHRKQYHCHTCEGQQSTMITVVLIQVVFQSSRGVSTWPIEEMEEKLCGLQK